MSDAAKARARRPAKRPRPAATGGGARTERRGAAPASELRLQRKAVLAAATSIAGLMAVAAGPSNVGAALTLGGLVALMATVHRFGRLGEDA